MVESPERFPIGLREVFFGLDAKKRQFVLRGLAAEPQERDKLVNKHSQLVHDYVMPLRLEEYTNNRADEMIMYRVHFSELLIRVWTLPEEDRAIAMRFLSDLEPDARVTHFSDQ